VLVVVVVVIIDIVFVDSNTPVGAATGSRTDRRDVAACSNNRDRGHLRNEDEIALGIRCYRVGIARLWDGFDKEFGFRLTTPSTAPPMFLLAPR
jgi:hypothetical protein